MKITKSQLKDIIREELQAVLENVPNPDFQRRAHGGKTCDEWNQEILELRGAFVEARQTEQDLDLFAGDSGTDEDSRAWMRFRDSGTLEAAEEAWRNAIRAAKRQKCPLREP